MKKTYLLSLIFLGLFACQSESGQSEEKKLDFKVDLICQAAPVDQFPNRHDVFFLYNDSKVKIASINDCSTIDPPQYQQFQIPTDALKACGGWWAGSGDYFYIQKSEEAYEIYQGFSAEEMSPENGFNYQAIASLSPEGKFQLLPN